MVHLHHLKSMLKYKSIEKSVPQGVKTLRTNITNQELAMTADISLSQFDYLKQPTSAYLFQIRGLIRQLQELRDEVTDLLFHAQVKSKSIDKLLKNGNIALMDLNELHKLCPKKLIVIETIMGTLILRKRKLNQLYQDYFSSFLEGKD